MSRLIIKCLMSSLHTKTIRTVSKEEAQHLVAVKISKEFQYEPGLRTTGLFSDYGPWTSRIRTSGKLVRNTDSLAPLPTSWIRKPEGRTQQSAILTSPPTGYGSHLSVRALVQNLSHSSVHTCSQLFFQSQFGSHPWHYLTISVYTSGCRNDQFAHLSPPIRAGPSLIHTVPGME